MPPVSIMADDPFGQFGQLSLDPCAQQAPTARNDNHQSQTGIGAAPATPPHFPNSSVTATIDANTLGMGNPGLQHSNPQRQPQQQQPMQVSPEQPNVPAHATPGIMHQSQQGQQQQQQLVNSSYQNNPYAQPPPMQYQQTSMPYQQVNNGTTAMRVMSPPVSPLRPPPSPGPSPPEVTTRSSAPNTVTGGAPSMPLFDTAQASSAGGGEVHVPALNSDGVSCNPVAVSTSDPFDIFAGAAPVQAPAVGPETVLADPFGIDSTIVAPTSSASQAQTPTPEQDDSDFWNSMGFAVVPPTDSAGSTPTSNLTPNSDNSVSSVTCSERNSSDSSQFNPYDGKAPVALDDRGLPVGGEYYNARVTTPMLGAIFSSGKELRSTLYKSASDAFVEAIGERPVISFTIDGSAADTAGLGLGHVLLKVNNQEVRQTDEAVKMVGAACRPMIMEFYVPNKGVRVVKTEGQCMVKYDNHSTEAPKSACEWKPKYVVVGDMLGKPSTLYMYRSKVSEGCVDSIHMLQPR